jgi:NAD(P)-dependent dehydrogenase (short-subunit alcohol dehydrogenase family)
VTSEAEWKAAVDATIAEFGKLDILVNDVGLSGSAVESSPSAFPPMAVEGLATDPGYARRYGEFQRLMVYGSGVEYRICIDTLRELSRQLSEI